VFEGIVYRDAYEEYLRIINRRVGSGPRLVDALAADGKARDHRP
jgi:hypothetical protein